MLDIFGGLPLVGDLSFAVQNSNLAGKSIVILLLLGSIGAWTVMIAKYRELSLARQASQRFLKAYRRETNPLAFQARARGLSASPLYAVYEAACREMQVAVEPRGLGLDSLARSGVGESERVLDQQHVTAIRNVAERTVADQMLLLETYMGVVATATTTAPFLGLLGTVWGVMDSFAGMAAKGTAMLSAVAPGISGALLTTVVGLLVALPSAVGYNVLTNLIRRLSVQTDNFAQELAADMERHYGQ